MSYFKVTISMMSLLQEAYIADLDAKSGASLKLTILNPKGRIWTMVAGGGASVVYRYGVLNIILHPEKKHSVFSPLAPAVRNMIKPCSLSPLPLCEKLVRPFLSLIKV